MDIKNNKAPGDTIIFVNHPKAFWKEQKLTPAEINAEGQKSFRVFVEPLF